MSKNNIKYMKRVGVFLIIALLMMPISLGEPDRSCLDTSNILIETNITIDDGQGQPDFFLITSTERCEWGCVNVTGTATPTGNIAGECSPHPVVGSMGVGIVFVVLIVLAFLIDRNRGEE